MTRNCVHLEILMNIYVILSNRCCISVIAEYSAYLVVIISLPLYFFVPPAPPSMV